MVKCIECPYLKTKINKIGIVYTNCVYSNGKKTILIYNIDTNKEALPKNCPLLKNISDSGVI